MARGALRAIAHRREAKPVPDLSLSRRRRVARARLPVRLLAPALLGDNREALQVLQQAGVP